MLKNWQRTLLWRKTSWPRWIQREDANLKVQNNIMLENHVRKNSSSNWLVLIGWFLLPSNLGPDFPFVTSSTGNFFRTDILFWGWSSGPMFVLVTDTEISCSFKSKRHRNCWQIDSWHLDCWYMCAATYRCIFWVWGWESSMGFTEKQSWHRVPKTWPGDNKTYQPAWSGWLSRCIPYFRCMGNLLQCSWSSLWF